MTAFQLRSLRVLSIALVCLTCATCITTKRSLQPIAEVPPRISPEENKPQLCIALSGGGIRAGAVALGVLQELHERGVLRRATYLTSVSGGGYPVYGILAQSTYRGASLDELLSESSPFISDTEKNANFIDAAAIITGIVSSSVDELLRTAGTIPRITLDDLRHGRIRERDLVDASALTSIYVAHIDRTFGRTNPFFAPIRLSETVIPRGFPYPIFIATETKGPAAIFDQDVRDKPRQLFEFSPRWIGSDEMGYWSDYVYDLGLADAIVGSSAALDTPAVPKVRQGELIPQWAKKIGISLGVSFYVDNQAIYVADGGFIENQAVLPLVRRDCGEIVAVDASADTTVSLEGWHHLTETAETFGWIVDEPRPLGGEKSDASDAGWRLPGHVWKTKFYRKDRREVKNELIVLKLGYSQNDTYEPEIVAFKDKNWCVNEEASNRWCSEHWRDDTGCNVSELEQSFAAKERCKFPLERTGNQSYTTEEFRAYRLLGKHMAKAYLSSATRGK